MTSAVASRLSIHDRGLLREGLFADIAVFDPATVADRATYEQPHQLSIGIRYVFVNGTAVVQDGKVTGAKPGRHRPRPRLPPLELHLPALPESRLQKLVRVRVVEAHILAVPIQLAWNPVRNRD